MAVAIIHHQAYTADTPDGHRFPMRKFARLAERLRGHGLAPDGFHQPEPAPLALLAAAHDPVYAQAIMARTLDAKAVRRIGFPLTEAVALRARLATGGTVLGARLALADGIACNTAGGSHHAHRGFGAGFCVFNDVAVAAAQMLYEAKASRILVVDLDVHHGDGTASIFAAEPRVFTFSAHCQANWPTDKPPSDLDLPLPAGLDDDAYLAAVEPALMAAIARSRADLAFYVAGVDPHRDDRLGKLALTDDGLRAREKLVLGALKQAAIPVCTVLGGGYDLDVDLVAARHQIVFEEAVGLWSH